MAEDTIKRQHVGGTKDEHEKNNGTSPARVAETKPEAKKDAKKSG